MIHSRTTDAKRAYRLFQNNPAHPGLQFNKQEGEDDIYSARIGLDSGLQSRARVCVSSSQTPATQPSPMRTGGIRTATRSMRLIRSLPDAMITGPYSGNFGGLTCSCSCVRLPSEGVQVVGVLDRSAKRSLHACNHGVCCWLGYIRPCTQPVHYRVVQDQQLRFSSPGELS